MVRRLILLTAIAAMLAPTGARATCDRDCKVVAANLYLASLVSHDASQVPLHPDAWRIENGARLDGGENIREANESAIMYVISGIRELRWFGEGDDVIALYFLDTFAAPAYIAERFLVDDDGLIREIEAVFLIDAPGYVVGPESIAARPDGVVERFAAAQHGPLGPVPVEEGQLGDTDARGPALCSRGCMEDLALGWVDAVAHSDANLVEAGDGIRIVMNRREVATDEGEALGYIGAVGMAAAATDPRVYVDGEHAIVFYELDDGGNVVYAAARLRTDGDAITEVEGFCDVNGVCQSGAPPYEVFPTPQRAR